MAETIEYLTENNRPLEEGEYFDHVNDCGEIKAVDWVEGDAYCPECGEMGTVYNKRNEREAEHG